MIMPTCSSPSASLLSRRGLLRGGALAVAAVAAPSLLTGCGSSASTSTAAAVDLPDYVPISLVKPDLPGSAAGVQDGFLKPVTDYVTSVKAPPGKGTDVRAFLMTYSPPPPPLAQNAWWQAVNKAVNANLQIELTPATDFAAKFNSVMAGGDVPDLVQMPLFLNLPRLPDLLSNRFADLSDHLAGAAVKDYPNLAALPSYAWRNTRFRGRIYGVPNTRTVFLAPLYYRKDLFDELGVTPGGSTDQFVEACKAATDPKAGRWALGGDGQFNMRFFAQVFGAPQRWRDNGDGTLTRDIETPEYEAALDFARSLNAAGYFHPDSAGMNISQAKENLAAGKITMIQDGPAGWKAYYDTYGKSQPGLNIDAVLPFAAEGGKAVQYFDRGIFSITALRKADPDRLKELLAILDYFAAPYGSKENLLLTAGVRDVDHTVTKDGLLEPTDRGKAEVGVNFVYVACSTPVLASGTWPAWVRQQYVWEQKAAPLGLADPTVGSYSDTAGGVGVQLDTKILDAINNIITGRAPMSSWKAAVEDWRSGGGDKIRQEYVAALAETK